VSDDHEIRTDLADMDLDLVHEWLSTDAYWSLGRTREAVGTAAEHSLNFGAFTSDGRQVAYARVVTDELDTLGVRRTLLSTLDAHEVYAAYGFEPLPDPARWMIREDRSSGASTAEGSSPRERSD